MLQGSRGGARPRDGAHELEQAAQTGQLLEKKRFEANPDLGEDPTGAGGHPTRKRVEVSVDDASFANPIEADLDEASGTWNAPLGKLARGDRTIHVRAAIDRTYSDIVQRSFTVVPNAQVQWQVVTRNAAPTTTAWQPASGLESWSFSFNTGSYKRARTGSLSGSCNWARRPHAPRRLRGSSRRIGRIAPAARFAQLGSCGEGPS